jgi:hypothetical protein
MNGGADAPVGLGGRRGGHWVFVGCAAREDPKEEQTGADSDGDHYCKTDGSARQVGETLPENALGYEIDKSEYFVHRATPMWSAK